MKEKDIRQEIFRLAHHSLDCYPITQTDASICPRCHAKVKPPIGRPDILILNPWGRSYVIEVKVIRGNSYSFSQLKDRQRKWLNSWCEFGGLGFLAIGTLKRPRRLWLIDWESWLRVKALVSEVQSSIPVVAGKGFKRVLQENRWDLDHLCEQWELKRITGGWELPADHSLRRLYESRPTA